MHFIEKEDLALGTVQRDTSEPVSWHGLETPFEGLDTQNCGLRKMVVRKAACEVTLDGEKYGTTLSVPCVSHPIEQGKLLFLGKPFDLSYALFDNAAFLDFAEQCFNAAGLDKKLAFTTTLFAGRRVTLSKRIEAADFKDAHGHDVFSYFNLLNSFDGSWSVFANISEIRTVCFNTATANLGQGGFGKKHTPEGLAEFIDNFPLLFAEAIEKHKGSANDYLQLANIPMTTADAQGFFTALMLAGEKLSTRAYNVATENLLPLFSRGKGCYAQSAADCYNAVTEYFTHNSSVESNSFGGTADMRKKEAKEKLLSDSLAETIEKGKKAMVDYLARV